MMRVIFFILLLIGSINGEKWFRHYGVSKNDNLTSMTKTKDSGFIFVGSSTTLGNGRNDLWVLKTDDSLNFNWQRFYGGPFDDLGKKIFPQKDGFIIIGQKITPTSKDIWILKIDSKGKKEWEKVFNNKNDNIVHSIEELKGVGFIVTGVEEISFKESQGFILLLDKNGETIWKKVFGGREKDGLFNTKKIKGGFISVGYTNSISNSGLKIPETTFLQRLLRFFISPKISQDIWLINLDNNGKMIWEKTYGGKKEDTGQFVFTAGDSSYLVLGNTNSFKSKKGDIWVIKTDDQGKEVWNNIYGGKGKDYLKHSIELNSGNVLMTLSSEKEGSLLKKNNSMQTRNILISENGGTLWDNYYSSDHANNISGLYKSEKNRIINIGYKIIPKNKEKIKFEGLGGVPNGEQKIQAWVFDIDTLGIKNREQVFIGDRSEYGVALMKEPDSDIYVLANLDSYNNGENDIAILAFNSFGTIKNAVSIIEDGDQTGTSFHNGINEKIIIIGETYSSKYAGIDLLMRSYDNSGKMVWKNEFGGFGDDIGVDVIHSASGGSIIAGRTNSFGNGATDAWLLKVDNFGQEKWSKSYGGKSLDEFSCISSTKDGNYIALGTTLSYSMNEDFYLMSIDEEGEDIWESTYGGPNNDRGIIVKELPSGGFILIGETQNSIRKRGKDIMVVRTNNRGDEIWSTEIGGNGDQVPYASCILNDQGNGYVIVGKTESNNGLSKILLMNISSMGRVLWKKSYGGAYISEGCSIEDDGTGLIVMGNLDFDDNGNSDIFLFKTDYEGLILGK